MKIRRLSTQDDTFDADLKALLAFETAQDDSVDAVVANILKDVKTRGDAAVLEYTNKFDKTNASRLQELEISPKEMRAALDGLQANTRAALEAAAGRVRNYHEKQVMQSWQYAEADGTILGQQVTALDRVGLYVPGGTILGQQVTALDRVGLYVPGGKAAYPSSVLMNAIPAKVAGVGELIMVVPTPNGERNQLVLAAAAISGVDRVFCIGGAQAVGALAYGTQTIPQVDKVTGPGNAYVAAAKRRVFGVVGIDMVAGPSEILVICDGKTDPDWIAMDLFSQAEHDELAQAILLSPDAAFLDKVAASMTKLVENMPRKDIISMSITDRGALIHTKSLDEAIEISNYIAPEHLELSVENPLEMSKKIKHAGAIFMGRDTCEALGDYCAGPNHVLPTSRTARFSSPLGVYDFQKRSSLIFASSEGAQTMGKIASTLAYGEGLQAHAKSAEYRLK